MPTREGNLRRLHGKKDFRFIEKDDGEAVSVHFSAIRTGGFRFLGEGRSVRFDCEKGRKGLPAECGRYSVQGSRQLRQRFSNMPIMTMTCRKWK